MYVNLTKFFNTTQCDERLSLLIELWLPATGLVQENISPKGLITRKQTNKRLSHMSHATGVDKIEG